MRRLLSGLVAALALAMLAVTDAVAAFPARTPADVVKLALLQVTTGRAGWTVWIGKQRHVVEVAQRGREVLLHAELGPGDAWVGYRLDGIEFVCTAPRGEPVGCLSTKIAGVAELGQIVLFGAVPFLIPEVIHRFFGKSVLAKAEVVQTREAGEPVSCLVASVARKPRRLCVTRYGFPSSVIVGKKLRAIAYELSPEVDDADLAPPAPAVETAPETAPQSSSSSARMPAA